MMEPVLRVDGRKADPCTGIVKLDWGKSAWNGTMLAGTIAALFFTTWQSVLLFLALTYSTLLIGHSVGMHRMMIHRTFKAPRWFARLLIYIGTLVGVAGPFGIIRIHDIRDWAQREAQCHDYFAHRRALLADLAWNLFYKLEFQKPPDVTLEAAMADDRFYRFLDKTWRWHQLPLAGILYAAGGLPFVLWGICARVFVSAAGHWTITYFCHNPQLRKRPGRWIVRDAGIQASNLTGLGILTYGECWHNNHHAFPESARIGLERGQSDPGWWVIRALQSAGLAYDVSLPRAFSKREDLLERNSS